MNSHKLTKQLAALVAVGLACAACGFSNAGSPNSGAPDSAPDANPLAEALATAAPTPTTSNSAPPPATPVTTNRAALPTPVTTFSVSESSQATDNVRVVTTANITRYALVGQNAAELDVYMRSFGPVDSTGNRWFALTEPGFDWRYPCNCDDAAGGCVTGPVTIFVTLDYTLPTWEPGPDADSTLVGQWNAFERAVVAHERGHGELASQCGQQLGEAFVGVPAQSSCDLVDSAVGAASGPVFAACRAAQREYEDSTYHGQLDGVLWPP